MSEPATITLRQLLGSCPQLSRAQIYNILRGPGGLSEEQLADEALEAGVSAPGVVLLWAADIFMLEKVLPFDEVLRALNFFAADIKASTVGTPWILDLLDFRYMCFSHSQRILDVKSGEEALTPGPWVRCNRLNLTSLGTAKFSSLGKMPGARR